MKIQVKKSSRIYNKQILYLATNLKRLQESKKSYFYVQDFIFSQLNTEHELTDRKKKAFALNHEGDTIYYQHYNLSMFLFSLWSLYRIVYNIQV